MMMLRMATGNGMRRVNIGKRQLTTTEDGMVKRTSIAGSDKRSRWQSHLEAWRQSGLSQGTIVSVIIWVVVSLVTGKSNYSQRETLFSSFSSGKTQGYSANLLGDPHHANRAVAPPAGGRFGPVIVQALAHSPSQHP